MTDGELRAARARVGFYLQTLDSLVELGEVELAGDDAVVGHLQGGGCTAMFTVGDLRRIVATPDPGDPITPELLRDRYGWRGALGVVLCSPSGEEQPYPYLSWNLKTNQWSLCRSDGRNITIPTPAGTRDLEALCQLLGVPCERRSV